MPTTSLTVDNELLSATSIEAAKKLVTYVTLSLLFLLSTTVFTERVNQVKGPVTSGLEVSRLGITLARPESKLVTSR